jgi:single stranded DNA-binding protein
MSYVNKVILIGRLGADPEMRYTADGTPVATYRIATTETRKNKDGKKSIRQSGTGSWPGENWARYRGST